MTLSRVQRPGPAPPTGQTLTCFLLQVWWAASDLGWVVGHSYICYAPLLHGNSTILYEVRPAQVAGLTGSTSRRGLAPVL